MEHLSSDKHNALLTNDYIKSVMPQLTASFNLIKNAQKITLLTHASPDPDGISACAALDIILRNMNKNVECIYPNEPEFAIKRQPAHVSVGKHTQTPCLLMALDTSNYARLYFPDEFKNIPLINIDHHVSNSLKGIYNFVDPAAASACELLYLIIMQWDVKFVDQRVSNALLYGILYDSQVFHTQNTTAQTLRIAAELIDKGADLFLLKNELTSDKNPRIIELWADMMKNIHITQSRKAAWSRISHRDLQRCDLQLSALAGFNNFLASIAGIDVTLLFYQTKSGQTKVSLRSKETDVNKLAAQFGGGGHKYASGILSSIPMDELIAQIIKQL